LEQLREEFIDEPERRRKANDMELNKEREKAAAAAENKPAAANSK